VLISTAGEVQHNSVRLPGAAESVSVAGDGISSAEVGISRAELIGVHSQEGRLGCLYSSTAGHHNHESYKAGKEQLGCNIIH